MAMGSNFNEYTQVAPVSYGNGAVAEIASKVKRFGAQKVILVFDGGVKASGMADRVAKLLEDGDLTVALFDDVKSDPTDAQVEAIGEIAVKEGAELVIGLGGGSVLDAAKMVGIYIKNPAPLRPHMLSNGLNPPLPIAPVILLPTTSGTGSEVSCVAVVSHDEDHVKDAIFANCAFVILDPELTVSAPPHVTAFAGLDALAHALESYTSASASPMTMLLATHAISLVVQNLRKAYDNGQDIDARSKLAFASNIAGMSFNDTGLHFGHTFGHELGGIFGLPHGMASSYAIPAVIKFTAKHDPERAQGIADAFGVATAEDARTAALSLMHDLGVRKFSDNNISVEAAQALAEDAIAHNVFFHNTVVPLSVDDFKDIIADIVVGFDEYTG
ncbi:MAG: iron-containing alcohol dehydrogenase [Coriobacteriales bacterium]|jgi:alcohol dehydrogenase class IV|nr:iron-containing alcohol dehydrogenase [Coriobacteriales bacterium]